MQIATFDNAYKWQRWFAWRPVLVADIEPGSDPWPIRFNEPKKLIWLEWVERRTVRSVVEQTGPLTMSVYRPIKRA